MREYQQCTRCVMDTNIDPLISFDENGYCSYCTKAFKRKETEYFPNAEGERRLQELLAEVKEYGKGKKYDCVMGLSGGLDSSYLAYLGHKWGLRVLAIHINDGFDTDISKENLRRLVEATGFDYLTVTPDERQFCDLTKGYMHAGVPNLAAPQDSILFAYLYAKMAKYNIRYFLTGGNFAGESIMEGRVNHSAGDARNIKDINKKFGYGPINKLKLTDYRVSYFYSKVYGQQTPHPLDYVDYNRDRAFKELYDLCGFQYYGRKHLENKLTAFLQLYWYPKRFNLDKRLGHQSSMIVSGQTTRERALEELKEPLYDETMMNEYITFIKDKLRISDSEFEAFMSGPIRMHEEFMTDKDELFYKIRHIGKNQNEQKES